MEFHTFWGICTVEVYAVLMTETCVHTKYDKDLNWHPDTFIDGIHSMTRFL